jgi:K+-transporting ATPase KdpF subunit
VTTIQILGAVLALLLLVYLLVALLAPERFS